MRLITHGLATPNLDAVERAESRAQLSADPNLGLLPDERTDRIKQAAQFAKTANAITLVAGFWALVYPRPYLPVIATLALLPLVVILEFVRSKGLYNLQGHRNEARPSVALALILPGPILMLRALRDIHLLHWQSVIPAAVILAAVLVLIVAQTSTKKHKTAFPVLLLFALLFATYAGCVIADANVLLDRSSPLAYRAEVLSASGSHGKSTTYSLQLGSWGPRQNSEDVEVASSVYNSVAPGDSVCVLLYPGTLRIPWFTVSPCP